eukprot:ANDGO_08521.mRNA.1 Protein transport protein SEC16A homolog
MSVPDDVSFFDSLPSGTESDPDAAFFSQLSGADEGAVHDGHSAGYSSTSTYSDTASSVARRNPGSYQQSTAILDPSPLPPSSTTSSTASAAPSWMPPTASTSHVHPLHSSVSQESFEHSAGTPPQNDPTVTFSGRPQDGITAMNLMMMEDSFASSHPPQATTPASHVHSEPSLPDDATSEYAYSSRFSHSSGSSSTSTDNVSTFQAAPDHQGEPHEQGDWAWDQHSAGEGADFFDHIRPPSEPSTSASSLGSTAMMMQQHPQLLDHATVTGAPTQSHDTPPHQAVGPITDAAYYGSQIPQPQFSLQAGFVSVVNPPMFSSQAAGIPPNSVASARPPHALDNGSHPQPVFQPPQFAPQHPSLPSWPASSSTPVYAQPQATASATSNALPPMPEPQLSHSHAAQQNSQFLYHEQGGFGTPLSPPASAGGFQEISLTQQSPPVGGPLPNRVPSGSAAPVGQSMLSVSSGAFHAVPGPYHPSSVPVPQAAVPPNIAPSTFAAVPIASHAQPPLPPQISHTGPPNHHPLPANHLSFPTAQPVQANSQFSYGDQAHPDASALSPGSKARLEIENQKRTLELQMEELRRKMEELNGGAFVNGSQQPSQLVHNGGTTGYGPSHGRPQGHGHGRTPSFGSGPVFGATMSTSSSFASLPTYDGGLQGFRPGMHPGHQSSFGAVSHHSLIPFEIANDIMIPPKGAQIPVASFGFGGKLVVTFPRKQHRLNVLNPNAPAAESSLKPGSVAIHTMSSLFPIDDDHAFPVQFGNVQAVPQLVQYVQRKISFAADADERTLWSLLMVELQGLENEQVRLQGYKDLLTSLSSATPLENSCHVAKDLSVDADFTSIDQLLLDGKRDEAVKQAVRQKQFALALMLSSVIDKKTFHSVAAQYVKESMDEKSPLRTLLMVICQNISQTLLDNSSEHSVSWQQEWAHHVLMLISNPVHHMENWLVQLGDKLARDYGLVVPSILCYMFAAIPIESPFRDVRFSCIGTKLFEGETMKRNEIYSFICKLKALKLHEKTGPANPQVVQQLLTPNKDDIECRIAYVEFLADVGYTSIASRYLQSLIPLSKSLDESQVRKLSDLEKALDGSTPSQKQEKGWLKSVFGLKFMSDDSSGKSSLPVASSPLSALPPSTIPMQHPISTPAASSTFASPSPSTSEPPAALQRSNSSSATSGQDPQKPAVAASATTGQKGGKEVADAGVGGFFRKLLGGRNKEVKLGDNLQCYYDEKLGRWVFPDEDPSKVAAASAPPPMMQLNVQNSAYATIPATAPGPGPGVAAPGSGPATSAPGIPASGFAPGFPGSSSSGSSGMPISSVPSMPLAMNAVTSRYVDPFSLSAGPAPPAPSAGVRPSGLVAPPASVPPPGLSQGPMMPGGFAAPVPMGPGAPPRFFMPKPSVPTEAPAEQTLPPQS